MVSLEDVSPLRSQVYDYVELACMGGQMKGRPPLNSSADIQVKLVIFAVIYFILQFYY